MIGVNDRMYICRFYFFSLCGDEFLVYFFGMVLENVFGWFREDVEEFLVLLW